MNNIFCIFQVLVLVGSLQSNLFASDDVLHEFPAKSFKVFRMPQKMAGIKKLPEGFEPVIGEMVGDMPADSADQAPIPNLAVRSQNIYGGTHVFGRYGLYRSGSNLYARFFSADEGNWTEDKDSLYSQKILFDNDPKRFIYIGKIKASGGVRLRGGLSLKMERFVNTPGPIRKYIGEAEDQDTVQLHIEGLTQLYMKQKISTLFNEKGEVVSGEKVSEDMESFDKVKKEALNYTPAHPLVTPSSDASNSK